MSSQYDPYIPNGPPSKTQQVQQQVDEVVGVMQNNIDKVMQRGERIEDLRGKTEDLQTTSGHFRRGANQVRKRMWWKDLKWKIIIAVTILVILAIIIGSVVGTQKNNDSGNNNNNNNNNNGNGNTGNNGNTGSAPASPQTGG